MLTGTRRGRGSRFRLLRAAPTGYLGSVLDAEGIALIAGLQEVLGAGVTSFNAGDIILGGDGSDLIMGRGGDDIIDGDKWLNVQIGVFAAGDTDHTGAPIALHNSMTRSPPDVQRHDQSRPARDRAHDQDSTRRKRRDRRQRRDRRCRSWRCSPERGRIHIDFNADGTITVAHTGAATDGTDTIRNIEKLDFTDQDISLQAPTLDLHGDVTTTTTTTVPQAYRDTFDTAALQQQQWHRELGGDALGREPMTRRRRDQPGRSRLDNGTNELRFVGGGWTARRSHARVNLSGLHHVRPFRSTMIDKNDSSSIDAGETVQVQYSASGSFAPGNFTVLANDRQHLRQTSWRRIAVLST